jgi:hypothetical protein
MKDSTVTNSRTNRNPICENSNLNISLTLSRKNSAISPLPKSCPSTPRLIFSISTCKQQLQSLQSHAALFAANIRLHHVHIISVQCRSRRGQMKSRFGFGLDCRHCIVSQNFGSCSESPIVPARRENTLGFCLKLKWTSNQTGAS